jgi:hypothetical protein
MEAFGVIAGGHDQSGRGSGPTLFAGLRHWRGHEAIVGSGSLLASGWSTTGDRPSGNVSDRAVRLGEHSMSSQGA